MKLSRQTRYYMALTLAALFMVTAFQNCGQPGSIAATSTEKGTGNPGGDPNEPDDTDPDDPGTPPPPPTFQNLVKNITVAEATNKVDVLVVIDNSGSMEYEQRNMGDRFDSFMDKLQGLDWQVGIVTTDMTEDKNLKGGNLIAFPNGKFVISSKDGIAAAKLAFAMTIQRPDPASGSEQGIEATYVALEKTKVAGHRNQALIRAGAALSVIVVTDADETPGQNDNAGVEALFGRKNFASNLVDYVTTTFPGKGFKYHSIIVKVDDAVCAADRTAFVNRNGKNDKNENEGYGRQYNKASMLTGGIVGSVCEADYSNQLKIIGQSTADQVKEVTLDCAPVDQAKDGMLDIEVRNVVNNTVLTNYVVNGRQVTFNALLPIANYRISYTCFK